MFRQFLSAGMEYQYVRIQNIRDISIEMMRGELRGEIFACLRAGGRAFRQVERGIVTEEGKI